MSRTISVLAGLGLGAGLSYYLDPQHGRRRYQEAAYLPGLQGQGTRPGEPSQFEQENWSPATRLLGGTAGAALFGLGLTQRFPTACVLGTAGLALMARSATNTSLGRLFGLGSGWRAVEIQPGALGHFVARLFGADPRSETDEDLVRLKSLSEEGKTSAPGKGEITRDQLVAT